MREFKTDLLLELNDEYDKARKRQRPFATRDSGQMRGLMKAMELIKKYQ